MCFNHFYKLEFNTDAYYWLWIMIEKWHLKPADSKWQMATVKSNNIRSQLHFGAGNWFEFEFELFFMWKFGLIFFSKSILFPKSVFFYFFFNLTLLHVFMSEVKKNLQIPTKNQFFHAKKNGQNTSWLSFSWFKDMTFSGAFCYSVHWCVQRWRTRFEKRPFF